MIFSSPSCTKLLFKIASLSNLFILFATLYAYMFFFFFFFFFFFLSIPKQGSMKFRNCPAHFLRKVEIPTLPRSIPTLRTEFISSPFPLYNSRIVRYNSRIGGQSRNSYFAQVQFRNCTDSYFAQNIYIGSHFI